MKALILGLGIPATIALSVVIVLGMGKLVLIAGAALLGRIRHEMVMRPKERYYRMGGLL